MSYTWRSILKGIELLKKGLIWRVGDGRNLEIWNDPWLPRDSCRRPITPRGMNLLRYVEELIDPTTGGWDVPLVRELFWEEDARLILALPVHEEQDNIPAWHFDSKGLFTVKSAYKVYRADITNRSIRGAPQSSSNGTAECEIFWKAIWNLKCPGKIKHFLWRFCHNSHALRMNLRGRGLRVEEKCVVCQRQAEDGAHLFFKCKFVKEMWRRLGMEEVPLELANMETPRQVVQKVMQLNESIKLHIFVLLRDWYLVAHEQHID